MCYNVIYIYIIWQQEHWAYYYYYHYGSGLTVRNNKKYYKKMLFCPYIKFRKLKKKHFHLIFIINIYRLKWNFNKYTTNLFPKTFEKVKIKSFIINNVRYDIYSFIKKRLHFIFLA